MKKIQYVFGGITSLSMLIVLLISSFEIAAYGNFNWYEKEYAKYGVLETLEMEMEDAMEVTEEMMAYLRGNRKDLVVFTKVNGNEREFFNDKEKAHMVDVLNLFLGGIALRRGAIVAIILSVVGIVLLKGNWKKVLPKSFLVGTGIFIGVTSVFGVVAMSDFNKYFTLFHKIFFDNDLWILNPNTDLLIRMLPEGFFWDMVIRIGTIFLLLMGSLLIISIIIVMKQRNKKNL